MKQYFPLKTHKYGVKIFKLCTSNGYTWNMKIYAGKESAPGLSVPTKIVTSLSDKLLNAGRTVITDNYYTSIELANILLDKKTHLIGTLRANRRGNPKEVTSKKLKVGEIYAKENNYGICVLKWKDRRDVLLLTTKHGDETKEVQRRTGLIQKPAVVLAYNSGKSSIDLSDQMASYNTALRKTIKWYRKIALEIILGTAIVNSHFLYKEITGNNLSITEFREQIVHDLITTDLDKENKNDTKEGEKNPRKKLKNSHTFAKKEGRAEKTRKYCRGCYEKKRLENTDKNKVKKVTTYCKDCVNQPHYCLECFTQSHK